MAERSDTEDMKSRTPQVSYDTERLGEPGQPGVPLEDQSPTNDENDNVAERGWGADLRVPEEK